MALMRALDVTMDFGDTRAVDHVDLDVEAGEVVGLLGANGAGKTTLIRLLLGLLAPTSGRVELLGGPPSRSTRRHLGYMPQGLGLYDDLTVAENLQFQARAFRDPSRPSRHDGERPASRDGLDDVADVLVGDLSLGARRRTAFAAALGHRPQALILDEPTSGVGPLGRAQLWDTIHAAADEGAGVLVSTHYMDEAEQCDRLVIMARGAEVASGRPDEIVGDQVVVEVDSPDHGALARLEDAGLVVLPGPGRLRVVTDDLQQVRAALDAPGKTATPRAATRTSRQPATLEEAFIAAVTTADDGLR